MKLTIGIGNGLAFALSLLTGNGVAWALIHGVFGWFYVAYFALTK